MIPEGGTQVNLFTVHYDPIDWLLGLGPGAEPGEATPAPLVPIAHGTHTKAVVLSTGHIGCDEQVR